MDTTVPVMELGIYFPFLDLTHVARKLFFLWIQGEDGLEMAAPRCCYGVAEKLCLHHGLGPPEFFLLHSYCKKTLTEISLSERGVV